MGEYGCVRAGLLMCVWMRVGPYAKAGRVTDEEPSNSVHEWGNLRGQYLSFGLVVDGAQRVLWLVFWLS